MLFFVRAAEGALSVLLRFSLPLGRRLFVGEMVFVFAMSSVTYYILIFFSMKCADDVRVGVGGVVLARHFTRTLPLWWCMRAHHFYLFFACFSEHDSVSSRALCFS